MDRQIFLDWQVHFNLRKPNSRKATLIYAVVTLDGQQMKINTGVKVYASQWDKDKQIARMGGGINNLDCINNGIVNKKIMEIAVQIERLKRYLCDNVELLTDEAKVKSLFIEFVKPTFKRKTMKSQKKAEALKALKVFSEVISNHWDYEKQGTRQKIATVREFCKWLERNGGDTLENVSKRTLALYEGYLNTTPTTRSNIGAEYKTVKTKIGHIMSVIRKAREFDYFPNDINVGVENYKFQTKKIKDDDLSRSFALTDKEVERLYNYQGLTGIDMEIRDLFVLQCEMGQRISTMLLWLKGEFQEYNGFFDMISTKIPRGVSIPITERIEEIREKYKEGMVLMDKENENTIVNIIDRTIKRIAKAVGLNRLHTYQRQIGDKTYDCTEPICDLMRSHIARHTFITQRLREGWTKDDIKIVTGHDDDAMIDSVYAHLSKEDKKQQLTKRINKVEEANKSSNATNVEIVRSDSQILIDEIEKLAVDINEKDKTISKKDKEYQQLSDIHTIIKQHDEYSTRRLDEIIEYGNLSGSDGDLEFDIPTQDDLV
ncbi:tyrosine-type recombinase/integrase [Bacteroides cellulosilyticus]|uniref:tyrosine-type recombinase/integrase n=1 Tax=Bacteroides cellulosilyticus TaxID=246787 RepID=UPI00189E3AC6|nr:tyrosine-type recombinase/integrase [Bacteroides cellulosilyticus]